MKLIEISQSTCVGCRLCMEICSLVKEGECSATKARIRIFRDEEFGNNLVSLCIQCAEVYCIKSCRDNALTRHPETGAVLLDENLCTGCKACVTACPVGGISYHEEKGIIVKCDLCGGDPECVKVCSRGAITLKDTNFDSPDRRLFMRETGKLVRKLTNKKYQGKPVSEVIGIPGG
ncbi:MAG: 4Fe-4S dicluster domain-containing protein [Chloroflexi bacterium]|nr:4Fe-4S dicluster domain-containing protein [Chloroflexota bacterium]MBI3931768.1 4Fe-4S dicluster domain-containing protein [Chloroflexota bacterium]